MEESPEKVYAQHRGLIRSLINSIVVNNPSVVDTQDLQQAGALALIVALRSYDPSLGSFPSYIRKCIRNALLEQANTFSGVFTVNEKVRRQANLIKKMREKGESDDKIMTRLGIKTRATFLSLLELVDNRSFNINQVEIVDETPAEENSVFRMLDEFGLTEQETELINLVINNFSVDEIIDKMSISRSTVYKIKTSIHNKILAWGRE